MDESRRVVIEFTNVGKTYDGEKAPALHDTSFTIYEGELVCFIGASGGGKTTVLKLIAGLEKESEGSIVRPPNIAMAFQLGALLPWRSVYDNVAFGLEEKNLSKDAIDRAVMHQLRLVGMDSFKDKYPVDLSGGQRQRVGIARALAVDPAVLLLDEPFSALDAKTTAELHDDLIRIWRETKKTIVMVSHMIEEAVSLSDRIFLMKDGTLAETFAVDLAYPRREQEAAFMHDVQKIRRAFFK